MLSREFQDPSFKFLSIAPGLIMYRSSDILYGMNMFLGRIPMTWFVFFATSLSMRGPVEYMTTKCFVRQNQGMTGFISLSITSSQKAAPGSLAMNEFVNTETLPLCTRNTSPRRFSKKDVRDPRISISMSE